MSTSRSKRSGASVTACSRVAVPIDDPTPLTAVLDPQLVQEAEQIAGEVRPRVLALGLLPTGPAVAACVEADHPPPGPDQGLGVERSRRDVGGAATGETVEADDERPRALVVVGDLAHHGPGRP